MVVEPHASRGIVQGGDMQRRPSHSGPQAAQPRGIGSDGAGDAAMLRGRSRSVVDGVPRDPGHGAPLPPPLQRQGRQSSGGGGGATGAASPRSEGAAGATPCALCLHASIVKHRHAQCTNSSSFARRHPASEQVHELYAPYSVGKQSRRVFWRRGH